MVDPVRPVSGETVLGGLAEWGLVLEEPVCRKGDQPLDLHQAGVVRFPRSFEQPATVRPGGRPAGA